MPLNIEVVPPEYLSDGAEILDAVLHTELERREVAFVQLTLVEGLRSWSRAVDAIDVLKIDTDRPRQPSLERARVQLVESLLAEFDAAGVIWPDLHERRASKKWTRLTWDGVTRRIPGPAESRHVHTPDLGSSLRIRVFDDQASLVSDGYQGLEPIHRFEVIHRDRSGNVTNFLWTAIVRTDLFENQLMLTRAARRLLPRELP